MSSSAADGRPAGGLSAPSGQPAGNGSTTDHGPTLVDRHGRPITYVRVSVTDRCDLRCQYCMPAQPVFLPKSEVLTLEELLLVTSVFAANGVAKVRVTGGEPLVRRNVVWLLENIAGLPGVRELVITTNGTRLPALARQLRQAGVRRVNISIDTLDSEKFRSLTRNGELGRVMEGFQAALDAGFERVKINTVLMRGVNDDELCDLVAFADRHGTDISFIEEMPIGDVGRRRVDYQISSHEVLDILGARFALEPSDYRSGGPARYWQLRGSGTKVGIIAPHSRNFCSTCNRVRITCTGDLYPCLGQNGRVSLAEAARSGNRGAILGLIRDALDRKPVGHEFDLHESSTHVVRFMSTTGG